MLMPSMYILNAKSILTCINLLLLFFCPIIAADPLCDIISASNIRTISGYSQWSCTTAGVASTGYCVVPVWTGLICTGATVVSINISNIGIAGFE